MKRIRFITVRLSLIVIVTAFAVTSYAGISNPSWTPIFKGICYKYVTSDTPRLQKLFVMRVDLHDPDIVLFSSPSNGAGACDTNRQTCSNFLEQYNLQVAMNANYFSLDNPDCPYPTTDLKCLAVSNGNVVSAPGGGACALMVTQDNDAVIAMTSLGMDLTDVYTAVGTYYYTNRVYWILKDGQVNTTSDDLNPLSSVGLSQDNRYLYMLVIDGRQSGYSMGCTEIELAGWMQLMGAYNALRLDGGGSSTMVKDDGSGNAILLNSPSDGSERACGNHLGVFAPGIDEKSDLTIVEPVAVSPASIYPGGTIPVDWTEKNKGSVTSGPAHHTKIFLSTSTHGTTYQLAYRGPMNTLGVGATQSYSEPAIVVPTSVPVGDYYVTVYIDCDSQVSEENENNNIGSSSPNRITLDLPCGGRGYPAGDISGPQAQPDCYVDLYDLLEIVNSWLECNDPRFPADCPQ